MNTITIELDDAEMAELQRMAHELHTTPEGVVRELVIDYTNSPPLTEAQRAAIEEGLAAIERGEVIPHAEVVAELRAKYGA
jgi:predicted transcriptional regulator